MCLLAELDDGGAGHAVGLTHRLQSISSAALVRRADQGGHDASAAGTQRVADGDCAAVDIGPIEHLIYSFPVLISSPTFRIGVRFPD